MARARTFLAFAVEGEEAKAPSPDEVPKSRLSPSRPLVRRRLLLALVAALLLAALGLWAERAIRLRQRAAEAVPSSLGCTPNSQINVSLVTDLIHRRSDAIPNSHHIWFSHDPIYMHSGGAWGIDMLNWFGCDYLATRGEWQMLCGMDSDGDGMTNGQELGDPCCSWRPGAPNRFTSDGRWEYRRWLVTHPAHPDGPPRLASQPVDCRRYNKSHYVEQAASFYLSGLDKPGDDDGPKLINLVCLGLLLVTLAHWVAFSGLGSDLAPCFSSRASLTCRTSLVTCCAAFVYMDVTGNIVHLILDYAPHWLPGLGSVARGFQYHHDDPTAIVRISWLHYASHIEPLCPLVLGMLAGVRASRVQRLFWVWGAAFAHLFQTTHRWAHFPPDQLPWVAHAGQAAGLFLTQEYHRLHHEDLGRAFGTLSGYSDSLFDAAVTWLPAERYDLWAFCGVAWLLLPFAVDVALRDFFQSLDRGCAVGLGSWRKQKPDGDQQLPW